jgi:hypothetical protein
MKYIFILPTVFTILFATIVNVPDEFSTIQAAISFSSDGDTVLVQPGTHLGGVNFIGRSIVVGSMHMLTGDESYIESTIIEGGAGRGSNAVIFDSGETELAELIGFTVTAGTASSGGGIHCSSSSSPTLSYLIVTGNHANSQGGGLFCQSSDLSIIHSSFFNNDSDGRGGGLYVDNCTLYMDNVTIYENISGSDGGGLYLTGGVTEIFNSHIQNNIINGISSADGGGIYDSSINSHYDHVSITGNSTAGSAGGGMYCTSNADLINVTVSGNEANGASSGLYFTVSFVTLQNCIVWGNTPNSPDQIHAALSANMFIYYSDIEYGWLGEGANNINSDPLFTNPAVMDYSLQQDSPCVDSGNPDPEYNDPDGTHNDMGAFYFHQEPGCIDESACNYNPGATMDDGSCLYFDCTDECGGSAFIDDCGVCSEGNTDHVANSDDIGCGCDAPQPGVYFVDDDEDGIGYGEGVLFCEEMGQETPNTIYELVPDGWVLTEIDNCPYTYNPDQVDADDDGLGDVCDDIYNGEVYLGFGDVDISNEEHGFIDLIYNSDIEIQSVIVQITELPIIDVDTSFEDFIVTMDEESGFINIFSFSGGLFPVTGGTNEVFATVQYEYEPSLDACLENPTVAVLPGNSAEVTLGDCATEPDPPMDCAGVFFGEAFIDDCGVCSGGITGHDPNSDMDCAGECYGGSYEDLCGLCDDDPGNDNETCMGCTDESALNYDPEAIVDDGSCLTPDTILYPGNSIQNALNAANEGDIILLQPGTYPENLTWPQTNDLTLIGSGSENTIINGGNNDNVIFIYFNSNGNLLTSLMISRLTITEGNGHSDSGGGIYCSIQNQPDHLITLEDLVIEGNSTAGRGGGLYLAFANATINNCSIINNESESYGGGVDIHGGSYSFNSVEIVGNTSINEGGGIRLYDCEIDYSIGLIAENQSNRGGGIYQDHHVNGSWKNVTINNNQAAIEGGGIFCNSSTSLYAVNCIVTENNGAGIGDGIVFYSEDQIFVNSIICNNGQSNISGILNAQYSNIQNGSGYYWFSDTCIDEDPQFIDPLMSDYTLMDTSPCIDAGTSFFVFEGDTLINLQPEDYEGFAPDMGVHETAQSFIPQPIITTIEDVPYDQGGQLLLQFQRSFYDRDGLNRSNETYTIESWSELPNGDSSWVNVISGTAYGENSYTYLVPTTLDSSSTSDGTSQYRVIAGMDEGNWGSDTMWGYSVDNIAPAVPTGLFALVDEGIVELSWDDPVYEDFQYFSIYRAGELVEYTVESHFTDTDPPSIGLISYEITATDAHGNEGNPSADVTISMEAMTGDFNMDYQINVVDVVELVYIILYGIEPTPIQLQTGDIDNNGVLNVVDVVYLVDLILNPTYSKGQNITQAAVTISENTLQITSDGQIAGIQLEVEGNYQIEESLLPTGWEMHQGSDCILIFSADGSALLNKSLLNFSGALKVTSVIVADWHGNSVEPTVIIIPGEFSLTQPYPNPFNPITTIEYQLPADSHVQILVFNIIGQEIVVLVDDLLVAGYHSVIWDASSYPSGIYIVRMTTDELIETKKVMYLK